MGYNMYVRTPHEVYKYPTWGIIPWHPGTPSPQSTWGIMNTNWTSPNCDYTPHATTRADDGDGHVNVFIFRILKCFTKKDKKYALNVVKVYILIKQILG